MSTPLWFGLEWEIALSGVRSDGSTVRSRILLDKIDKALSCEVLHVRSGRRPIAGSSEAFWLCNGGKFYRDASHGGEGHDEYCSPECSHPDELLLQDLAGERLVIALSNLVAQESGLQEVVVSKANVCSTALTSWGFHENYHARRPVSHKAIIPWLVSRIALCGAGGIDVRFPGIRFTLSQRAHFTECAVSEQTEHTRPIHNLGKAVAHGEGHRVHVVVGDGNRAPFSTWLKFATTAIVVRLLDLRKGPPLGLAQPVEAFHALAYDPEMHTKVQDSNGNLKTILDFQSAFLNHAKDSIKDLPEWAPLAIEHWQHIHDTLRSESGWKSLVGQLDWPTKLSIFNKVLNRSNWSWDLIGKVNCAIDEALQTLSQKRRLALLSGHPGHSPAQTAIIGTLVNKFGSQRAKEFFELRNQLRVMDARYMQLGDASTYDHFASPVSHLADVANDLPLSPLELPLPRSGRAKIRATLIREHGTTEKSTEASKQGKTEASWTHFLVKEQYLYMPDVNEADPSAWQSCSQLENSHRRTYHLRPTDHVLIARTRASNAIDSGDYGPAVRSLVMAQEHISEEGINQHDRVLFWRQSVRTFARAQKRGALHEALSELDANDPSKIECLWERCNAMTWLGLAGDDTVPDLAEEVRIEIAGTQPRRSGMACWKSHLGVWHNRNGMPSKARDLLESSLDAEYPATSTSVQARIQNQLGEAYRMLGDFARSGRHFDEAAKLSRSENLQATTIDFVETGKARLSAQMGDFVAAGKLLTSQVLPVQTDQEMPNRFRTRLLLCRLERTRKSPRQRAIERQRISDEIASISGLSQCPRMARILSNWEIWCEGGVDPGKTQNAEIEDLFWGI